MCLTFLIFTKSSQSAGNYFLLPLNPKSPDENKPNLERFLGLPGISSTIEWGLVENFPPVTPGSCAPVVCFRTLGCPTPQACKVFLCSSAPSPFAAAAVTARIKEDVQYVLSLTLALASMALLRWSWLAGTLGSLQATQLNLSIRSPAAAVI